MNGDDEVLDLDPELLLAIADAAPATRPTTTAREAFFRALSGPLRFDPFAPAIADMLAMSPADVSAALSRIDDPSAWAGSPDAGRHIALGDSAAIVQLPAATPIQRHAHRARELTFVVDGVLISGARLFRAGDCIDMLPGTEHELRVGDDGPCIVVLASPD